MDIKNYVMPIVRRAGDERSFAGTAFCIHGQLVTAAHVLDWGLTRSAAQSHRAKYTQN